MFQKFSTTLLRYRWGVGFVLFALAGAAWWWQATRPLATLVLPDGTKILLRKLSVGPEYTYQEPHRPGTPIWQRILRPFGRRVSGSSHSPVLFLTQNRPETRTEEPAVLDPVWLRLSPAGTPIFSASTGWGEDFTMVHTFNYPRREKTMRIHLSIGRQWREWEVPNPLYGRSFPDWTAPPFPQTKRDGDLEFTATGWKATDNGWELAGEAKYRGKTAEYEMIVGKVSDATGNRGDPSLMPTGEPAWELEGVVIIGAKEPLTPDRLVDFGQAKVPADGEYSILPVPARMMEGQETFAAVVGRGPFAFRNGTYSADDVPAPKPSLRHSIVTQQVDEGSWLVQGEVVEPTLIMLEMTDRPKPTFASESIALKCLANGVKRSLLVSSSISVRDTGRSSKKQTIAIRGLLAGTMVSIRSVRPERLQWKGLVRPPW